MRETRLFFPSTDEPGRDIELGSEHAHVVSRVLRLNVGESVTLLDGRGGRRRCEILSLKKNSLWVRIHHLEAVPRPQPDITLAYAMPKGEKASEVIRRCVEWGVSRLVFLASEYAVAKPAPGQRSRWERVAVEAMRQSGNPFLPDFVGPLRVGDWLQEPLAGLKFVLDTANATRPLVEWVSERPSGVLVAVGPEGGWAEEERLLFQEHGFASVRVGPYVLRTENAAISAVALMRGIFGRD